MGLYMCFTALSGQLIIQQTNPYTWVFHEPERGLRKHMGCITSLSDRVSSHACVFFWEAVCASEFQLKWLLLLEMTLSKYFTATGIIEKAATNVGLHTGIKLNFVTNLVWDIYYSEHLIKSYHLPKTKSSMPSASVFYRLSLACV